MITVIHEAVPCDADGYGLLTSTYARRLEAQDWVELAAVWHDRFPQPFGACVLFGSRPAFWNALKRYVTPGAPLVVLASDTWANERSQFGSAQRVLHMSGYRVALEDHGVCWRVATVFESNRDFVTKLGAPRVASLFPQTDEWDGEDEWEDEPFL